MPKITTLTETIGGQKCKIELWYETGNSRHSTSGFYVRSGLPADMEAMCKTSSMLVGFSTQAALESKLHELIRVFNDAQTSDRKILVVDIKLGVGTSRALNLGDNHPMAKWHSSTDTPGHGFDLSYRVLIERTVGSNTRVVTLNGGYVHPISKNYIVIDYTEEREAFFKAIIEASVKMGRQIADFFGADPLLLAEKIDSGQKLLG